MSAVAPAANRRCNRAIVVAVSVALLRDHKQPTHAPTAKTRRARPAGHPVTRPQIRRFGLSNDGGSAVIEFVFAAVVMMVPLVYLVVTVATVQRAQLALTNAARDAGRAFATARNVDDGLSRARVAARIAFDDAHYDPTPTVRYVAADASSCDAPPAQPSLQPGADFTVCVARALAPPAVPGFTHFRPISVQSLYRVHIDDFRSG